MDNELTNLLPFERQRALAREYFLRLSVVTIVIMTTLTVIAGLLLLPTFMLLTQNANTKQARLASIESALSSADEKALSAHLTALSNNAATLIALGKSPSASALIRGVLAVSRPGVTLSGFTYTPTEGKVPGTLAISGSAITRDALRNYQLALQQTSFATAADLPVSAYAKDTDITFVITATLSP